MQTARNLLCELPCAVVTVPIVVKQLLRIEGVLKRDSSVEKRYFQQFLSQIAIGSVQPHLVIKATIRIIKPWCLVTLN